MYAASKTGTIAPVSETRAITNVSANASDAAAAIPGRPLASHPCATAATSVDASTTSRLNVSDRSSGASISSLDPVATGATAREFERTDPHHQ